MKETNDQGSSGSTEVALGGHGGVVKHSASYDMPLSYALDEAKALIRSEAGHIAYLDDALVNIVVATRNECALMIKRERSHFRERASVFRAQGESTNAHACDTAALALAAVLAKVESAQSMPSGTQTADPQDTQ